MATGTEVLNAGRGEHVVLFYQDEQELAVRVNEYLLPAVTDGGGAVIVIATPDHRRSFEEHLAEAGADVAAARARGSYLELDANETIGRFMTGDRPDPAGFWQVISPLLRQAAGTGPVRVFGEMVSLLCAYPARPVTCSHYLDALTEVCRAHTEVTGSPPAPELARPPGL